MRRIGFVLVVAICLAVLAPPVLERVPAFNHALTASANSAASFPPGTIFTVSVTNTLDRFNVSTPGFRLGSVNITGLNPSDDIVGIDFRPATGQLYGLGRLNQLYVINVVTGVASPVNGGFTPALDNAVFGFDFNPTVDRIRVVSSTEQNLRLHPDTGQTAAVDGNINPAGSIVGSAYTNNFAGATSTVLYGIDSDSNSLVIQNPPNDGTVTPVGPLGVDFDVNAGFDIAPGSGIAYAALFTGSLPSNLYTINLATGAATLVGAFGGGGNAVRGLAYVTGPETIFGVTTSNNLVRFNSNTPGTIVSTSPITGLQGGENILGIDFRPATGQLYGLGSTSRIYRIDPANGSATQVGAGTFTPALSGTDFGFDFNPTVDRIRIVSDAEQNIRAHPDLGTIVFTDINLTPAGNVVAAAYTNNFAGATVTALYDVDSSSDLLLTQNPPNNGQLNAVGPLGVNASGATGFDIAPSGMAFASITLQSASTTNYYSVNLGSGAATLIGTIGGGEVIRDTAIRVCTEVAYGVTQVAGPAFNLISFNAATPGIIISTTGITGLQAGESIVGIDFRPATGQLYAVGNTSRLYTINLTTGLATQVGTGQFTTLLSGANFGVDFNPTVDRLRIVSDAEQSIALNPNTAAVTVNGNLNPGDPTVVAAAYVNNFAGATTTTLYDVDSSASTLSTQNTTTGTLTAVGALGISLTSNAVGLDVASGSGNAYLSGYTGGANPGLYSLNLGTGAVTLIGNVNTTDVLVDFSVRIEGSAISSVDSPAGYDATTGAFFERNMNSPGPADTTFVFGAGGATIVPLKGDWDGDGDDTVGIYDTTTAAFFLRNGNSNGPADAGTFTFGPAGLGLMPITGDWDNDGDDTVGLYDPITGNFFLKNSNSGGNADLVFSFGAGGAVPIAGDWNADNTDTIGIYIAASGTFFLRNSNSNGPADITFSFGAPGATPLAGDWNADGTDSVGIYNSGSAAWFLTNTNGAGATADFTFTYGSTALSPLAGDWDGR